MLKRPLQLGLMSAASSGSGVGPGSATGWTLERNITQILQTNSLPQNVRSDVQRSPDAFDNRRSIIEGHGAGGTRHPDSAAEVAQASGLAWTSSQRMELLPPDGASLSSRQELSIAAAEHRAEVKAHQAGSWKDWSKGKGGKAEKDDGAKGKGKKGKANPKKD